MNNVSNGNLNQGFSAAESRAFDETVAAERASLIRARKLAPFARTSLVCLALGAVGCGDDGSSLPPNTELDAGMDAGIDAGPDTDGTQTSETGSSEVSTDERSSDATSTRSDERSTSPTSDTTNTSVSDVPDGSTGVDPSSDLPDGSTEMAPSSDVPDSSTSAEFSSDVPDGGGDSGAGTGQLAPPVPCTDSDAGTIGAKAIAVGYLHTCIAQTSGDVCCWGDNADHQLGNADVASSLVGVKIAGVSDVVALSAQKSVTCALTESGDVYCWGNTWSEEESFGVTPQRVEGLEDVASIASGFAHTCALTAGGQVHCWGSNFNGILGDDAAPSGKAPVLIEELSGITAITATDMDNCALRSNGTVACWGSNVYGQLGDGSEPDPDNYYNYSTVPVEVVEVSDVVAIAGSREGNCALLSDGSVWCWGNVPEFITGSVQTTPIEMTGFGAVASLAGTSAGFCLTRPDGTAECWGYNGDGGFGDGTVVSSSTPVAVSGLTDVVKVVGSSAANHLCALRENGSVACWGDNGSGQLGNGEVGLSMSSTPLEVAGDAEFVGLSVGNNHSCGTTATGEVWCWGGNFDGEVGNGQVWQPQPTPAAIPNLDDATGVTAGNSVTCVLREGGSVDCLGYNAYGQLGDGTTESRVAPTSVVDLDDATRVSAGFDVTCAVRDDATVQCWGNNVYGMFGTNPYVENGVVSSAVPVTVPDVTDAVQVSVGMSLGCALTSTGTVQCWGVSSELTEEGYSRAYLSPTLISGVAGATGISTGMDTACAVLSDGTVKCWGQGGYGVLGLEPPTNSLTPVTIDGLTDVAQVAVGAFHVCARRVNGTVACWGTREQGSLGDGLPVTYDQYGAGVSYPPVEVALTNVVNLAAGNNHSCATVQSGETYCWGRNWGGMLGTGETPFSTVPVEVVFQ
jgi:alpha-tubulin suppressor-like RCC1 family protein